MSASLPIGRVFWREPPWGGIVGGLTGLFGAGGGFIITPALNIFLGLPMNLAVGTSSCQIVGASAFSLFAHLDKRLLGIRVALCFGAGIPFGAFLGALLVKAFKGIPAWQINGCQMTGNFSLLVKPASYCCNLRCSYCFYLRKSELFGQGDLRMDDNVLSTMIRKFFYSHTMKRFKEISAQIAKERKALAHH